MKLGSNEERGVLKITLDNESRIIKLFRKVDNMGMPLLQEVLERAKYPVESNAMPKTCADNAGPEYPRYCPGKPVRVVVSVVKNVQNPCSVPVKAYVKLQTTSQFKLYAFFGSKNPKYFAFAFKYTSEGILVG